MENRVSSLKIDKKEKKGKKKKKNRDATELSA